MGFGNGRLLQKILKEGGLNKTSTPREESSRKKDNMRYRVTG